MLDVTILDTFCFIFNMTLIFNMNFKIILGHHLVKSSCQLWLSELRTS